MYNRIKLSEQEPPRGKYVLTIDGLGEMAVCTLEFNRMFADDPLVWKFQDMSIVKMYSSIMYWAEVIPPETRS